MTVLSAKSLPTMSLPMIDVSGLRSPSVAARLAVARQMREACLDKGFFYIRQHGVSERLQRRVFEDARRFFALPQAAKDVITKKKSFANRGYEPFRGQTLEPGAPPDLKEGFYLGAEHAMDDPRVIARKFQHGPNQWPELPGFRATMDEYYAVMLDLERVLWRGLALSLDLEEGYFDRFCHEPITTLRLLHYPTQPANPLPNEKGCGAHTDFGGITLLLQDDVGGLQVWDEAHGWIHAPPLPGTYVVNLGDMVARWTNDRYRSTLHRVVNVSGRERYSVPFFFNGHPDYVVSCLAGCLPAGQSPKYSPTSVSGHLEEMFHLTYGR